MEKTLAMAKAVNKAKGFYFFDRGANSFFRSKYHGGILKEKYFITSEQFSDTSPRLYTLREIDWESGDVKTVGGFQNFTSKQGAVTWINQQS
jgi:hypothetical protein